MLRTKVWTMMGLAIVVIQMLGAEERSLCTNDPICFEEQIDAVKPFTFIKEEKEQAEVIEQSTIQLIPSDSKSSDGGKNLQVTAQIKIDSLIKLKTNPEYSILKTWVQSCPDLQLEANLRRLAGKEAVCVLNENITEYRQPEDIYWCQESNCNMGKYAQSESDERYQLIQEGLQPSTKCEGVLWDKINAICSKNKEELPEIVLNPKEKDSRCSMPHENGPCKALFWYYYYDAPSNSCKEFVYGGCEGSVPFETREACKAACVE